MWREGIDFYGMSTEDHGQFVKVHQRISKCFHSVLDAHTHWKFIVATNKVLPVLKIVLMSF